MRIDIDLSRNPSQKEFFNVAMSAAAGRSEVRHIMMGGAMNGGKTIAALTTLTVLCAVYPGSRWVIYRKDLGKLKETTIPSMQQIVDGLPQWHWDRGSPYKLVYVNGSEIWFVGENIDRDPSLGDILGLEINGCLLEQCEELTLDLYEKIQSRIGRHKIPKMPKPLIFMTVNPTQGWPKKVFYEAWRNERLEPHMRYIPALTKHNPYADEEDWKTYSRFDDQYRRQMIEGDWTDMSGVDDRWAYGFDRERNIAQEPLGPEWDGDVAQVLYLSFDFNRNPITCAVIQHYEGTVRVLEQIKLGNSDIYQLCARIKARYAGFYMQITGDATGQSGSAMVEDNLTYYKIIMRELMLTTAQFKLPTVNPKVKDNRVLVNSLLQRYSVLIHPKKGEALIYDLENVKILPDGSMNKTDRKNPAQQADALDCLRYWCNTYMSGFVKTG